MLGTDMVKIFVINCQNEFFEIYIPRAKNKNLSLQTNFSTLDIKKSLEFNTKLYKSHKTLNIFFYTGVPKESHSLYTGLFQKYRIPLKVHHIEVSWSAEKDLKKNQYLSQDLKKYFSSTLLHL